MHSLLGAASIALDLARHPAGAAVAETAGRLLVMTPAEVDALSDRVRGAVNARAEDRALLLAEAGGPGSVPDLALVLRGVQGMAEKALPSPEEARVVVRTLDGSLLLRLPDLLRVLAAEGPLTDPRLPADGIQAALDAVAAAWIPSGADAAAVRAATRLATPWREVVAGRHRPSGLDGLDGLDRYACRGTARLLEAAARLDVPGWGRVVRARDAARGSLRWSTAMHEACRTVEDAGRVVQVARAQFAAARVLRRSVVSTSDGARSAAMALTSAVQAECVADLLPGDVRAVLGGPWEAHRSIA